MTVAHLDAWFPYICFAYGFVMTMVLASDRLNRLADERFPEELVARWRGHRGLAAFCLVAGAAWILQNLWLT